MSKYHIEVRAHRRNGWPVRAHTRDNSVIKELLDKQDFKNTRVGCRRFNDDLWAWFVMFGKHDGKRVSVGEDFKLPELKRLIKHLKACADAMEREPL